ncbi:MAG: LytR family transcriptional regulator [Actinobacteria bacterium]|nr:MAG: LytR family transcriptional regulator [Actinomycetota bacterium]
MTRGSRNPAGYPTASMAGVDKPYRVYRGGRAKGKVPLERPDRSARGNGRVPPQPKVRRPRRRWSWRRRILVGLLVLIVVLIVWAVAGFLAFRSGVKAANSRLPVDVRSTLRKDNGALLNNASNILLLGTDHMNNDQRISDFHSDSIMLLRIDPSRHRLVYLSVPRDLRVPIPGHGLDKVNAATQIGGPALAVRTISGFTGLPVNHVLIIDFHHFRELIDSIGGITVNVPERILSNPFDCPYTPARCSRWKGWRFAKGPQHMDGWRAQIYSLIRENQLNAADNDITRGERQQAVLRAVIQKLTSVSTFLKLPLGHEARAGVEGAPLPTRGQQRPGRELRHHPVGGQPPGDRNGHRGVGATAAATGHRLLRSRVHRRDRQLPLMGIGATRGRSRS